MKQFSCFYLGVFEQTGFNLVNVSVHIAFRELIELCEIPEKYSSDILNVYQQCNNIYNNNAISY